MITAQEEFGSGSLRVQRSPRSLHFAIICGHCLPTVEWIRRG